LIAALEKAQGTERALHRIVAGDPATRGPDA
jgi:hypothetical protein